MFCNDSGIKYLCDIGAIFSSFLMVQHYIELPFSSPIINDHDNLTIFKNNIFRDYNYSNNNNNNGGYIFKFNSNGSSIMMQSESNKFIENTNDIINNNYYI